MAVHECHIQLRAGGRSAGMIRTRSEVATIRRGTRTKVFHRTLASLKASCGVFSDNVRVTDLTRFVGDTSTGIFEKVS